MIERSNKGMKLNDHASYRLLQIFILTSIHFFCQVLELTKSTILPVYAQPVLLELDAKRT